MGFSVFGGVAGACSVSASADASASGDGEGRSTAGPPSGVGLSVAICARFVAFLQRVEPERATRNQHQHRRRDRDRHKSSWTTTLRTNDCRFTCWTNRLRADDCLRIHRHGLRWRRGNKTVCASPRFTTVDACSASCSARAHVRRTSRNAVRDFAPSLSPARRQRPARSRIGFTRFQQRIGLAVNNCSRASQRIRWLDAGHQVIERRSKRIEIAARVSSQALNLFQRRVVWRVTEDTRGSGHARDLARLAFSEAEIEQDDLST